MKYTKLSNSLEMPYIAYGTPIIKINTDSKLRNIKSHIGKIMKLDFKSLKKEKGLKRILKYMRKNKNISMIDTSSAYGASEYIIGKNINCNNRNRFFIVTKLSNKDQYDGDVEKALRLSLKKLNIEYVDAYLMHWPVAGEFLTSWKKMEKCYKIGLCKSIGVCNCNIHHLEEIKKIAEIKPMINQIECHPLFTQNDLRDYCKNENITVMAYTSTARMDDRLKNTCIPELAKKYNKTIAQIILKWHTQIGNIPIFNTNSVNHYKENIDIEDFEMTEDEINRISSANINSRLRYDPDNCNFRKL